MGLVLAVVVDDGIAFDHVHALAALVRDAGSVEPTMPAGDWEVTIRLCGDAAIAELHDRFFGDPTPTDIITFPSGEPLDARRGYLGDIVISVDTAGEQALEEGHRRDREIAFLVLHGLLHLAGWTDDTNVRRAAMLARQTELLEAFERGTAAPW